MCVYLAVIISSLLFLTYPKDRWLSEINPSRVDHSYASLPFDRRNGQSILRYFARKEQLMKQSSSKTILHNTFKKPLNKTSFLIYEHSKYRQFCMKQYIASVFIPTCPYRNCRFTCNSSMAHAADAILMLYSHLTFKKMVYLSLKRDPNQIWLLWNDEPYPPSPIYNRFLFNWTINYRLDSEVSISAYGITLVRNEAINQTAFGNWINENYKKRHNEAVW